MPTLLIDGDLYAYKASAAVERATDWGDGVWTLTADENEAWEVFEGIINKVVEEFQAEVVELAFSDKENFRKAIWPDYKANRANTRKPLVLGALRKRAAERWSTRTKPGLEADDVLGILATHPTLVPGEKIIVSGDKDLLQIPGWHFNPDTLKTLEVLETDGHYAFLTQVLTGDSTDNYPGCPGVGPKKADDILFGNARPWGTDDEAWRAVVKAYQKAKLTEEDALIQARVARILRAADYDFKNKEPILWTPSR